MSDLGSVVVPVKIAGEIVGRATIYSNGKIVFDHRMDPDEHGRHIYELLRIDFARGLSIAPILNPATPAEST